ncbi:hypothetical protein WJ968_03285 [Achromobacter xylosoxidans]
MSCNPTLTQNPWSIPTDPELGLIPLAPLHHIDRARNAIETIARMVGNSAAEPDATGAQPLDAWTVASLMGGVECLCEHLGVLTETMLEQARALDAAAEPGAAQHAAPAVIQ